MSSFWAALSTTICISGVLVACGGQGKAKPYSHPALEVEKEISRQNNTPGGRLANETKLALSAVMNTRVALLQAFQPDTRVTPCSYPQHVRKDVDSLSFELSTSCMRWGTPQTTAVGSESFLARGTGAHRRNNLPDSYDFKNLTVTPKSNSTFDSDLNPKRIYNFARSLTLTESVRNSGQTTYIVTASEQTVLPKADDHEAVDIQMTLSAKVTVSYADLSFVWDNVRVLSKTTKGEEKSQLIFSGSQLLDTGTCIRPQGRATIEQSRDGITDIVKSAVTLGATIELTDANASASWEGCAAGDLPGLKNFIAAVTAMGL